MDLSIVIPVYNEFESLPLLHKAVHAALQDLNEAIRLAPEEPHLYILREQAHGLLGQDRP